MSEVACEVGRDTEGQAQTRESGQTATLSTRPAPQYRQAGATRLGMYPQSCAPSRPTAAPGGRVGVGQKGRDRRRDTEMTHGQRRHTHQWYPQKAPEVAVWLGAKR